MRNADAAADVAWSVETDCLVLSASRLVRDDEHAFTKETLTITRKDGQVVWDPSMKDDKNLGGTVCKGIFVVA